MKSVHRYFASLPPQVGKRLFLFGWMLFLLSLCLPALNLRLSLVDSPSEGELMSGWICARIVIENLFRGQMFGGASFGLAEFSWHLCALGNLCAAAAPLFLVYARNRRVMRVTYAFYVIALAAALYQMVNFGISDWQIGYYTWIASFGMLAAGSLNLASRKVSKPVPAHAIAAYQPRTPEEMAAERELKEYLRSH